MATSKMKEAALAYARDGWPIFPVRPDKSPYNLNGVSGATTDIPQIEEWWDEYPNAAIGLNCGMANLVALDYDTKHGQTVEELREAVRENVGGELPNTRLRSRTPSGGEHHFYASNHDEIIAQSQSKIAKNVDVRAFQSYVILPPSTTQGGTYEWIEEGTPALRTDIMAAVMKRTRERSQDFDNWTIEPDLPENVEWAIGWLKGERPVKGAYISPAIEGQGGDHTTYATAAMLKTLGISQPKAFELMWDYWNKEPMAQPPWPADELEEKIENGYAYNTSPPGHLTAAYHIAEREAMFGAPTVEQSPSGGHTWEQGGFRIVDRAAISDIEDPEWLVPGLLPEQGFAFLVGTFGTYKTFIALDIALTIAAGKTKWEHGGVWHTNRMGPVLFAAGEGRSNLKKRIAAWEKVYNDGQPVNNFYLCDPVPRILDGGGPAFISNAKRVHDEYALVVLDTVGRAMQQTNENSQEAASAFTAMVEGIQRELGASVLALHHSGKDRGGPRGSSVFAADADVIVETGKTKQPFTVALAMDKQKDAAAWDKPIGVGFTIEGKTLKDEGTLVAKPAAIVVEKLTKASAEDEVETEDELQFWNDLVVEYLERNKNGFSDTGLAKELEGEPGHDKGHSAIRNTWLRKLKQDQSGKYPAKKYFNNARDKDKKWLSL